jgi:hypothetical protein
VVHAYGYLLVVVHKLRGNRCFLSLAIALSRLLPKVATFRQTCLSKYTKPLLPRCRLLSVQKLETSTRLCLGSQRMRTSSRLLGLRFKTRSRTLPLAEHLLDLLRGLLCRSSRRLLQSEAIRFHRRSCLWQVVPIEFWFKCTIWL